jgi:hypothetical protein
MDLLGLINGFQITQAIHVASTLRVAAPPETRPRHRCEARHIRLRSPSAHQEQAARERRSRLQGVAPGLIAPAARWHQRAHAIVNAASAQILKHDGGICFCVGAFGEFRRRKRLAIASNGEARRESRVQAGLLRRESASHRYGCVGRRAA